MNETKWDTVEWGQDAVVVEFSWVTRSRMNDHGKLKQMMLRAKEDRKAGYYYTPAGMEKRLPLVVKMTRVSPRMLDDDNLRGALKSIRDGVADRLRIDDRDPRVKWEYDQRFGAPKQHMVVLEFSPGF